MKTFPSGAVRAFSLVMALSLALAACAPAAPPSASTQTGEPTQAPAEPHVTDSGFVCPEPNPRLEVTSKEVNLFVWTEYIPQDILDCFEMVYGVTVNREEFSSNEEMYAKLAAGATNYDLTQPSDYIISLMIRQGMLQKLDKSRLPNYANIAPQFRIVPGDPSGEYTVPYQAGTESLIYDSATVKEPPQAFADLWKPDYAGRMVFVDDPRAVIGYVLLTQGLDPNTRNPADLEAIKPRLIELVNHVKIFDSDSPKTALIAGDADLGFVWNGEAELAFREKPTLTYVFPTEGTLLWQDGYVVLKDAPHLDEAYAWMNYSLQGDVFWLMLQDFPYSMPNQAALDYAKAHQPALYDLYVKSPITNTPPEVWQNGWRADDVGEALPLYDQLWTEAHSGP